MRYSDIYSGIIVLSLIELISSQWTTTTWLNYKTKRSQFHCFTTLNATLILLKMGFCTTHKRKYRSATNCIPISPNYFLIKARLVKPEVNRSNVVHTLLVCKVILILGSRIFKSLLLFGIIICLPFPNFTLLNMGLWNIVSFSDKN